jgi:hypothetical protein
MRFIWTRQQGSQAICLDLNKHVYPIHKFSQILRLSLPMKDLNHNKVYEVTTPFKVNGY